LAAHSLRCVTKQNIAGHLKSHSHLNTLLPKSGRPLVSIVIPSFNQGRFIAETLSSCLKQQYRPIEILVQDGGSTDNTISVLRSLEAPELYWASEPDQGVVDAVNKGLRRAKGEILSIQSSDDLFVDGAIEAAVGAFSCDPTIGLLYGDVELIDEKSVVIGADIQGPFDLAMYFGRMMYIPQPGSFFGRKALEAVGGWRREFSYTADADFWFRIALRFPVHKLNQIMARYRYHPLQRDRHRASISRDWERMVCDLIVNETLDGRTRRYARSGICLAHHRYTDPRRWWSRTKAIYSVLVVNPRAVLDQGFPKKEFLPGREPLWQLLSRAKRALGLKPRGT
jgi:glycosyltransferase involved in cell wall biosynthesis